MRRLYLIELYSGSKSVSRAVRKRFRDFDLRVLSVDVDPKIIPDDSRGHQHMALRKRRRPFFEGAAASGCGRPLGLSTVQRIQPRSDYEAARLEIGQAKCEVRVKNHRVRAATGSPNGVVRRKSSGIIARPNVHAAVRGV